MKTKILAVALSGLAFTTPAMAENAKDWYISGAVGLTSTRDADFEGAGNAGDFEIDNTANFAIAAGRQVNEKLRTELELSYRKAGLDTINVDGSGSADITGDVKTITGLVNVYYDLTTDKDVNPYLSAGIGFAKHDIDDVSALGVTSDSEDDTVFAYQLGAGVSRDLNDKMTVFGGYRYLGSSDLKIDALEAEYGAHEFRIGTRYSF